ncbi:WYL domain-containing protein [Erysipelatoclostridium ramosum]|nr:WYL domain-containing protein [Thomasclavelia ramosa]
MGWVFSLGEDIKIVGPDDVVKQMQKEIERLIKQYTINEQI